MGACMCMYAVHAYTKDQKKGVGRRASAACVHMCVAAGVRGGDGERPQQRGKGAHAQVHVFGACMHEKDQNKGGDHDARCAGFSAHCWLLHHAVLPPPGENRRLLIYLLKIEDFLIYM